MQRIYSCWFLGVKTSGTDRSFSILQVWMVETLTIIVSLLCEAAVNRGRSDPTSSRYWSDAQITTEQLSVTKQVSIEQANSLSDCLLFNISCFQPLPFSKQAKAVSFK